MYCSNCGTQISESTRFCPACSCCTEKQVASGQTVEVSPVGGTVKIAANASFASAAVRR
ncbi:MAG: zinc-ribbon domain-containing protein [Ruminiclostridium sp.]|nr:zinc-ribbon domain-containing protein [Ruminiclostridium sp.]